MAESVAIPAAVVASPAVPRPGFWERVVAFAVDLSIVSAFNNLVQQLDSSWAFTSLFALVYFVFFWSGTGGGHTWGMRVMGLRVVREDGSPLDLVRSLVRFLGLIVSCFAVFIGVIWVAFDPKKQGWHDKFAGSLVVAQAPAAYQAHPVQLAITYPASPARFWAVPLVGLFVKLVALIPIFIAFFFIGLALFVALIVLWIPVLFMGTYPTWGRDFISWAIRWSTQVSAFLYGLTDSYPLGQSAPGTAVTLTIDTSPTSARYWAIPIVGLLAKFVILVPAYFLLYFVGQGIGLAALGIAWAPVLFTGVYPSWCHRFLVAYLRWSARASAYVAGLTDTYPRVWDWEQ